MLIRHCSLIRESLFSCDVERLSVIPVLLALLLNICSEMMDEKMIVVLFYLALLMHELVIVNNTSSDNRSIIEWTATCTPSGCTHEEKLNLFSWERNNRNSIGVHQMVACCVNETLFYNYH